MTVDEIVKGEAWGKGDTTDSGGEWRHGKNTKTPGQAPRYCNYSILPHYQCFEKSIIGLLLLLLFLLLLLLLLIAISSSIMVTIGPLSQIRMTRCIVVNLLEQCNRAKL